MRLSPLALLLSIVLASSLSACSKSETDKTAKQVNAAKANASATVEPTKEKVENIVAATSTQSAMATPPTPNGEVTIATSKDPDSAIQPKDETLTYAHPESIVLHGDKMYVSNVGAQLTPTELDSDGYILITSSDGNLENAIKLETKDPLHAPKGMMYWNDALFVTDVNHIYGFKLEDNSTIFKVEPGLQHPDEPQPKFLNDIVAENDSSFFVTATDTNTIYRVTNDFVPAIFRLDIEGELKGPNGLAYDSQNKKLYIAGWGTDNQANGELGVIDLSGEQPYKYTRLGEHSGHLDGLVKVGDILYFSDWVNFETSGVIYSYNLSSGETKPFSKEAYAGPADFTLSNDKQSLVIPAMLGNDVINLPLPAQKNPATPNTTAQ